MIYKNTTPIAIYGADADNFLESCGIELYEDSIAIGESMFDGHDGECLLNENGIFLYEDHIVLEGEQAEAYKVRKAKEKQAESDRWEGKYQQRMGSRSVNTRIVAKDRPHYAERSWNDDDPEYYKDFTAKSGGVDHNRIRKSNLSPSQKINHAAVNHKKYADAHQTVTKIADKRAYENKWANDNQKVDPINTKFKTAYAADSLARHERKQEKKDRSKQYKEGTIFESVEFI